MASTIGMMDEAYFVGRNELLAWIRSVTGVALDKVEEACTGAVYCQVIEALHPGTIKLAQVKTKARSEYDYICNFKLLQKAFDKLRIQKRIEVDRLIKGKPLDNIEFCQWFKRYSDTVTGGGDAVGSDAIKAQVAAEANAAPKPRASKPAAAKPAANAAPGGPRKAAAAAPAAASRASAPSASQAKELQALQEHMAELKMQADMLEKERDFYYAKLRDVEIIAQAECVAGTPLVAALEKVLYADGEESVLDETMAGLEEACKASKAGAEAARVATPVAEEPAPAAAAAAPAAAEAEAPASPATALTPSKRANIMPEGTPKSAMKQPTPLQAATPVDASPMAVDDAQ